MAAKGGFLAWGLKGFKDSKNVCTSTNLIGFGGLLNQLSLKGLKLTDAIVSGSSGFRACA